MLRAEHCIVRYENGRAFPDRLTRGRHRAYLAYVERMLAVYRSGRGMRRCELHRSVENILSAAEDCDRRCVAAFCKLLDDRSEFQTDPEGEAASLRLRVFTLAAPHHPLVGRPDSPNGTCAAEIESQIAFKVGLSPRQLEQALYADVIPFQPLIRFEGDESAACLLSRYNVAQLQACLYRATSASITATTDFKMILRYAKLSGLMHEIRRVSPEHYQVGLSGPASFLRTSRRYGVGFSRFVSGLLACRGWEMRATLQMKWGASARLSLRSDDGYHTHVDPPAEFDSSVEATFAADFGPERDGWRLVREGVILHDRQTAFVPDFVLRHRSGFEVLLEIVGFWTREYLDRKRQTLLRFARQPIVVAVAERNCLNESAAIRAPFMTYRKRISPDEVLQLARAALAQRNPAAPVG